MSLLKTLTPEQLNALSIEKLQLILNTEIKYEIPAEAKVKIIISDLLGREIALLADDIEDAGIHRVLWNGKTDMGAEAASGMYLYSIIVVSTESGETATMTETKKILLLR